MKFMVTEAEELAERLGEVVGAENVTVSSFAPTPEQLERSERLAAHLRDRSQPLPEDVLEHQEELGSPAGSPFERFIEYLMQLLTGEEQPRTQLGEWFVDRFGGDRDIERDAPAERDAEPDAPVIASETPERAPTGTAPDTGTPTAEPEPTWYQRIIANNEGITDELRELETVRPGQAPDRATMRTIEAATIANFGIIADAHDSRDAQRAAGAVEQDGIISANELRIYRAIIERSGVDVSTLGITGVRDINDINEAHELGTALIAANEAFKERYEDGPGR
jgi:hypothetical protein